VGREGEAKKRREGEEEKWRENEREGKEGKKEKLEKNYIWQDVHCSYL